MLIKTFNEEDALENFVHKMAAILSQCVNTWDILYFTALIPSSSKFSKMESNNLITFCKLYMNKYGMAHHTQQNMHTVSWKGNIFLVTGPLWGVSTGHQLMFSLIWAWTNCWTNNREAGDWDGIALNMTSLLLCRVWLWLYNQLLLESCIYLYSSGLLYQHWVYATSSC